MRKDYRRHSKDERGRKLPEGVFYRWGTHRGTGKMEKIYYISFYRNGVRIEEKAGREQQDGMTPIRARRLRDKKIDGERLSRREEREAARAEAAALKAAADAEAGRYTFNRLWEEYLKDPENVGKRGNIKADLRYKKHIKPRFGEREPSSLKVVISADGKSRHNEVDLFRLDLAKKYSRETTKSIISLLTRIARYGASKGYCGGLPFPVSLRGKKLGRDAKIKRIPNEAETAAIIRAAKEWPNRQEGNFLLFIVHTGMRRGSAWNLKWADVDLDNATALLRDSKTGDVRISISEDAVSLLRDHLGRPKEGEDRYVFTGTGQDGRLSLGQINRSPRRIADAAGWPKDLDPCHSFRRMLATKTERMYGVATAQALGGWKTPAMVLHYTAAPAETLREAANAFGKGIRETEVKGGG